MTKEERETIIRWDEASEDVILYTANASVARKWTRLGYVMQEITKNTNGEVTGWEGIGPKKAVTVRRLSSLGKPRGKGRSGVDMAAVRKARAKT